MIKDYEWIKFTLPGEVKPRFKQSLQTIEWCTYAAFSWISKYFHDNGYSDIEHKSADFLKKHYPNPTTFNIIEMPEKAGMQVADFSSDVPTKQIELGHPGVLVSFDQFGHAMVIIGVHLNTKDEQWSYYDVYDPASGNFDKYYNINKLAFPIIWVAP